MTNKFIKTLNLTILLLTAPAAWAETTNCTPITILPYVITVQGIYCLTGNLATADTNRRAIEITTNNVVIDLNGWKLGGLAAGPGTLSIGIYAFKRKNITIRNGTIRGFYSGIRLEDTAPHTTSQGHLIEDIRADKNTNRGIVVHGRGNTVRRNQVVDTGGSTVTPYWTTGINMVGPGARLLNNDISNTVATDPVSGYAHGAELTSSGAVVEGNRIDNTSSNSNEGYGLRVTGNDILVAGNRITVADYGIAYLFGSTGKYMDNLTSSVTTPFFGGTAVGTNN